MTYPPSERKQQLHAHFSVPVDFRDEDGDTTTAERRRTVQHEQAEKSGANNEKREVKDVDHIKLHQKAFKKLKDSLAWIPPKCTFSNLKPVIRSSITAWVSLVLFLIPAVDRILGSVSNILLLPVVTACSSGFDRSVAGVVEKEGMNLVVVSASWAWSCLAIKIANLARKDINPNATSEEIFSGQYIEAGPSVVFSIFLFLGTALILFARARLGPGPFVPATSFACLCVDISLTTAPLYPYNNYAIGEAVVRPIVFHAALSLLASVLIFPETVNAQFVKRLKSVMVHLSGAMEKQNGLLRTSPLAEDFNSGTVSALISDAEGALAPLEASARLIKRDLQYGRFNGNDLRELQMFARKLTMRAAGIAHFYNIMDWRRSKFPQPLAPSRGGTPSATPNPTRPPSPSGSQHENSANDSQRGQSSWTASVTSLPKRLQRSGSVLTNNMLRDVLNRSQEHHPVGVFESQYYMNIEKRLQLRHEEVFLENGFKLLATSVQGLLNKISTGMDKIIEWLEQTNTDRLRLIRHTSKPRESRLGELEEALVKLKTAMDEFSNDKRYVILEPYRDILNPLHTSSQVPPHRYLFRAFLYQYHVMRFAEGVHDLLQKMLELDTNRTRKRIWPTVLPLRKILSWSSWGATEGSPRGDDEDPNKIPGIEVKSQDLGAVEPRNPDALPPANMVELFGAHIYVFLSVLGTGNALFGLKAGHVVLLALPSLIAPSAAFAFRHKSVWALFIAQLTMSRYRGDTISAFISRLSSTFFGLGLGLIMWYVSSGSGDGNAYGIAAVGAVVFPVLMFVRLYTPGSPMSMVVFSATVVLVFRHSISVSNLNRRWSVGTGEAVALQRFVLASIGVTASAIFSYLPPSTTIRRYHRTALSTTITEIGYLYCAIISYATTRRELDSQTIINNMTALRSKLRRMRSQTANVGYEISLRGKWPIERYEKVFELQMDLAYHLTHFLSVVDHLEPKWTKAFLLRTRFVDSAFLGDVLAIITMISTALRTGMALPQITPAPLLERFWRDQHGFNILRQNELETDDYGLPRKVTFETLKDEQYMFFSVAVSRAYSIISHLDLLMVATKELVGEQFHIEGIEIPLLHAVDGYAPEWAAQSDSQAGPR
ncbi:hypothetical protein BU17DRAFT_55138 [Hysterangium stoloniferum]|nr:hypothetical protein BU17DRAFT_55138 [Hysterangium stoloniferum]